MAELSYELSLNLSIKDDLEDINEFMEDVFPRVVCMDQIKVLKEKFLNQKRIIKKQLCLKEEDITKAVLKLGSINHCEVQYICQVMDKMQEADFSNIILGRYLTITYPELAASRWHFVLWILKCQLMFRAQHDTFQQAVVIFDQYMLRNALLDSDCYLKLALVSFWISCKMEEIQVPSIDQLLDLVEQKFTVESILELEIEVLESIDYGVIIHAPVKYLQMIVMLNSDAQGFPFIYEFSKVLIDLCVLNSDLASYPSCFIAATSYCVSQYMVNKSELNSLMWNKHQMFLTGIRWEDIEFMCNRLKDLIHNEFNNIWKFLNEKVSFKTLRSYSWLYLKEMCYNPSRNIHDEYSDE